MTRYFILPIALCALFLAGCSRTQKADAASAATSTPTRISVTVAKAGTRTVAASISATGSFIADETSDIAPLVAGRVVATPVNIGDFVKQGQVICELDHRDAQLRLDQAKAQLDQAQASLRQSQSRIGLNQQSQFDASRVPEVAAARASYESAQAQAKLAAADAKRYENLVATGDVSRSAYEKARTAQETAEAGANAARQQYEAAQNNARQNFGAVQNSEASLEGSRAMLAQAEKGLADTTIRAPFDGYITDRPAAPGEYVALNNKIATIVRVGTIKLNLNVPEQQASEVKVGMTVNARVAAYPNRDFSGRVAAINPSVDPNSRVFIVEVHFPNPKGELRPGMFSTARILLPGGEQAVFVPRTAVNRDKTTDSYQVFVVDNNAARLHVVVTGDADGDQMRITSGLTGNETVVTSAQGLLYDGAPVQVK